MNHSSNDEQSIARELEALGEAPLSADELLLVRGGEADEPIDLRNVGVLFGIAHPSVDVSGELDELQRRRVWNVVEERGLPFLKHGIASDPEPHTGSHESSGAWRVVIGAVAVAAGVLLVPRLAPPTDMPSEAEVARAREDLEGIGAGAHAAVDALPGANGSARAQAMAQEYAERLSKQRQEGASR